MLIIAFLTVLIIRAIIIHLDGFPPGKLTIEDNTLETDSEDLPDIDYSEFAIDNEES